MSRSAAAVVHVTTGLGTGGAERMLCAVAGQLVRRGWRCDVVSLGSRGSYGDRLEKAGATVHTLGVGRAVATWYRVAAVRRLVAGLRPDIVQGWMYHGNLAASLASGAARCPLAWNIRHALQDLAGERFATRQVIRAGAPLSAWADKIVYNSSLARDQHARIGYRTAGATVIANGFDVPRVTPTTRSETRRRFGLPADAQLVGMVARYHPVKDPLTFLRAAARVSTRALGVRFVCAGAGWTPDNADLSEMIRELDVADRLHLLGELDDSRELMPGLDLLALTSRSEAFPNVVGEAMAAGVPVVSTDVGDVTSIVGVGGVVTPVGDHAGLADGMIALLSDERRLRSMGDAARHRVVTTYSMDAMVDRYEDLYRGLIGR